MTFRLKRITTGDYNNSLIIFFVINRNFVFLHIHKNVPKMAGLNIESVRNQNKINVYAVKNKEYDRNDGVKKQPSSLIFSAYLTEGLSRFSADVKKSSLSQQIGETVKGFGIVGDIMGSAVGKFAKSFMTGGRAGIGNLLGTGTDYANAINYNFNYRFTGTSEFSHIFKCILVVKDDFIEDVIKPLWNILEYVLPDESSPLEGTNLYQVIEGGIRTAYDWGKDKVNKQNVENPFIEQDALDKVWKYIQTVGGEVDDMAGSITVMKKPRQLRDGMSHTRITIGDYIEIDDVIIDSVGFSLPYLLYEGGLFDSVVVDIKVSGNRKMTLKTYDWIRRLVVSSEDTSSWQALQSPTLNARFEPTIKTRKNEKK